MERARILIVGAGLAGLALARALQQAGLAPEVIERAGAWDTGGSGMYLPANGVRALRTLGLEEAVAVRAAEIPRQRLLDHRGRRLAEIDLHRLWGDVGPCLALPRTELHAVLRDGVPVRLGRTIRSLERLDGPVQVAFDDDSVGEFDLVVGADGLRSQVRRLAVDDRPPASRTATRSGGCASASPPSPPPVPGLLDQLDDPARVHAAPIEQVAAELWGRGAVVLVGDAAHGMSPNMAQGASLAFEDALVLAAELRRSGTVTAALAGFVARRSPRTGWVRSQTHRRDRTRDLPPALRNLTLRTLGRRIFQSNHRPLLPPILHT